MFVYLFIIFQIIYSISCDINCHDCPIEANTFDYLITADRLPNQLNNCGQKPTDDICKIDIIWGKNPDKTQIALSGRDEPIKMKMNNEETLNTNVQLENQNNSFIWSKSVSYACTTEMCNSFDVLKRVLSSLTLTDTLEDLEDLLKKKDGFVGTWCSFARNTTTFECAKDIPTESCKECSFQGLGNSAGSIEYCENCLMDDIGETFISHEVDFNMSGRTRRDHWIIECQSPQCNTVSNGNLVRQKSSANFNFAKFYNDKSKSTNLLSMNKFLLIFIGFFIKYLYQ